MKGILYTVAKDSHNQLIKAQHAIKGNTFFCPVCNNEVLLRKSGNTGKNSKRPHFAHKTLTPNCTPETALHFSFKNLLASRLQEHITNSLALNITWNCCYCKSNHSGNLLKKIRSVEVELDLNVCRPDIALIDENDNVFAVIEVVVSHNPEQYALEYYKSRGIILIQINLQSDDDIYMIDSKIAAPNIISTCFNPKCSSCGGFLQKRIMLIVDGPCWKCDSLIKVATVSSGNGGMIQGIHNYLCPSDFSQEDIQFAISKGVILKPHFSKTANETYLANTCSKCGSFAGDFHIFSQYIAPANSGMFASEEFHIGYHCESCKSN